MNRKALIIALVFLSLLLGQAQATPRYISLAPSTTEILFALGLDKEVVGVSSYCNYPPQAKTKNRAGDFTRPNIEKILSMQPDYIFCTGLEQAPAVQELKRLNLKVYVADPARMEELFTTIGDIGRITDKTREAGAIIRKMKEDIEGIAFLLKPVSQEKRVKVFIEIWGEPLMTAGKGSFIDEIITLAGGINIAHDTSRPYSIYSSEKVVSLNPGVIIMGYMDKESPVKLVAARVGWQAIDAVRNKRVFNDINPDILLRPGPRITEGLKEIYKRLYP